LEPLEASKGNAIDGDGKMSNYIKWFVKKGRMIMMILLFTTF